MRSSSGDRERSAGSPRPRARFFGPVPAGYRALNRELLGERGVPASGEPPRGAGSIARAASLTELEDAVKVVTLPMTIAPELSAAAIAGMERLRELELLTALRGARPTDLPRPEGGRHANAARMEAPGLVKLVEAVERALAGTPLFVRAVKLDQARASSTSPIADRSASNLHFDAEKSSLAEYPDPIYQFYMNAGALERQFRILPISREAILAGVPPAGRRSVSLKGALERYLGNAAPALEVIPVPTGALAIFDGRRFAHDAGKCNAGALLEGRFEPAAEPDLVLALDTVETGYHVGHYRPERPFFEDSGA